MKKIVSLFLAFLMVIAMAMPVFAADDDWEILTDTPSITIVKITHILLIRFLPVSLPECRERFLNLMTQVQTQ